MKGSNCRAWLYRILRNIYINEYHRKVNRTTALDPNDLERHYHRLVETTTLEPQRNPSQELFDNLLDKEVVEAMSRNYGRCGCYFRIKSAITRAAELIKAEEEGA